MSKKLQGNGLFESSRMMLPEHKEAYNLHQQNVRKKPRPQLDEQEIERISGILAESLQSGNRIALHVCKEYEDAELRGVVTKIDGRARVITLDQGDGLIWVHAADIVDAIL